MNKQSAEIDFHLEKRKGERNEERWRKFVLCDRPETVPTQFADSSAHSTFVLKSISFEIEHW
jgi:hypothetical protein